MLDLFWTTLLTALTLLLLGGAFLTDRPGWRTAVQRFPRSQNAAYVTMGAGGAWFLYKMLHLGPEDALFGAQTNTIFFAIFGLAWLGSFFVMKDFLAVRGLAVLVLMLAFYLLKSAFGLYELPARLFLVSFVYVAIVLAIWLGVSPFRARDFLGWLYRSANRTRFFGGALAGYGLILGAAAFSYSGG